MDSEKTKKNLEVTVEFVGAVAGVVTGSGTIVTVRRGNIIKKFLIDFGLFQGDDAYLNEQRIIMPEEIDFVLLTHSHLDHCGGIPILYKSVNDSVPYTGKVYGSAETLSQASHIIKDAAKINIYKAQSIIEEQIKGEAFNEDNKPKKFELIPENLKNYMDENTIRILYTLEDAEEAITHFKPVPMNEEITICEGIDVKFIPNSHINGSAMIEIYASYGAERYGVAFTGDIGKRKTPLYREMTYDEEPNVDAVILESLHGTEDPEETYIDSIRTIKKILKRCIKEQKNLYIPVFALDRSAIFIMIMNQLMDSGIHFNCFFDSPLGEKELQSYLRSYHSNESHWFDYDKAYPFNLDRIDFVDSSEGHMRLVKRSGPNVILTSSCMGYGGRVVDYFEQHIQDDDAVFIFPGFLPEGCPSKILLDAKKGEIIEFKDRRHVKHCETYHLNGFSSHGYLQDKLEILARYNNATKIFLTHGDEKGLTELEEYLSDKVSADIIVPDFCEPFVLN